MDKGFRFWAFKLSAVCVIVFILQLLISGFTDIFILDSSKSFEVWRVVTAIFLHASVAHLILNLFALMLFGSILEKVIGGKRFLTVFFVSGIIGNIVSLPFYSSALGASGAIFGVFGCLIILRPMMVVWTYGMPMPMFAAGIVWAAIDVIGVFAPSNVGNIAHLSGLGAGLLFGALYFSRFKERREGREGVILDEERMRRWEDEYL